MGRGGRLGGSPLPPQHRACRHSPPSPPPPSASESAPSKQLSRWRDRPPLGSLDMALHRKINNHCRGKSNPSLGRWGRSRRRKWKGRSIIHHIPPGAVDEDIALAQGPGGVHIIRDVHPLLAVADRIAGHERGGSSILQDNAHALAAVPNVASLDTARGANTTSPRPTASPTPRPNRSTSPSSSPPGPSTFQCYSQAPEDSRSELQI